VGPKTVSDGRALKIGITIGLHAPDESLWTNGIKQNALYLAKLLLNSPRGHEVTLLNTTQVFIGPSLPWDIAAIPTAPYDTKAGKLDVLIELGGQINEEQTLALKAAGTKIVSYCCGPEYVQNMEAMIFGRRLWDNIYVNRHFDELWMIPQIYAKNRGYLQTLRRCPARKVPFVWDPMAIEAVNAERENGGVYRPGRPAKRLTVIEPNIDVLKFCLYPTFIAELAFRQVPEKIEFLHVTSADHMAKTCPEFIGVMRQLDIVNANRASFIGRVRTPDFLSDFTDIVISHHWGVPLNYFYFECCWLGYPFIHNAELASDLGYYYPDDDLDRGCEQLLKALNEHDQDPETYLSIQRQRIQRFLATNQELVAQYDTLLDGLLGTNPA
jgi:hypothetical protein